MQVHTDSAAAIGICKRSGIGKVRHLAVAQLWVQERLREGAFTLYKVAGQQNPADMLTKALVRADIDRHLGAVGLQRCEGRAASAPRLTTEVVQNLGDQRAPGGGERERERGGGEE